MATVHKLQGVGNVLKEFSNFESRTAKKAERGLLKAALFILRKSQKIVPVDTGALKNSGRARLTGRGFTANAIIEYLVAYAIYVHENLEAKHKAGKFAKFVEIPMRAHRQEIKDIIRRELQS